MSTIKVLDCTLRDGGYCNQWEFGEENIRKISYGLVEAGINIIEMGFLSNKVAYDKEKSQYTSFDEAIAMLPSSKRGSEFVCMINYGEYNIEDIPMYEEHSLDGIRVAFHKKDMLSALEFCKGIKDKGFKVYVQAMVTLSYSDEEFMELIKCVNELNPCAFYIVDSFGVMKRNDLLRLFYIVDKNVADGIAIGFHSHNNLQLAYSNAQSLLDIHTGREVIVDSSVFGMGRGAGNLNTELLVDYLNDNMGTSYLLKPLLFIIDEILNDFYQQKYWGYSLPNYLSAKHNIHPSYAGYLDEKKTLTVENIDEIFEMLDEDKRLNYDREYIEELYIKYLSIEQVSNVHLVELKEIIKGKEILLIAPGKSIVEEKDKVIECAKKKGVVTISINFEYNEIVTNFIFLSNLRRYKELEVNKRKKCIVTSNIPSTDVYLQTKYNELLNPYEAVEDNAGMMLIKYLICLGAKKILLAGLDGYSIDPTQNFVEKKMNLYPQKETIAAMNRGMRMALDDFMREIDIEFVTTPRYVRLEEE